MAPGFTTKLDYLLKNVKKITNLIYSPVSDGAELLRDLEHSGVSADLFTTLQYERNAANI